MNSNNLDIEQMRKTWIEMGKALGMDISCMQSVILNLEVSKVSSPDPLLVAFLDFTVFGNI